MARQGISNDDTFNNYRDKLNGFMNIYKPFVDCYYKFLKSEGSSN
jgi:hypothetical protein